MNTKEVKNLSRSDLLEMLIEQTEKADRMEKELEEAKRKVEDREIIISKAGTLAEAAMQMNEVWQAADKAAAQYLSNIMRMYEEQERKYMDLERDYAKRSEELMGETIRKCEEMEQQTKARCEEMTQKAEAESQAYWNAVYEKLEQYCSAHDSLKSLLRSKG